MKRCLVPLALLGMTVPAPAQKPAGADEVRLDLTVRDKKGRPVTDLKPDDLTVLDNDAKQTLTSFRLVSGTEVRLVTLVFEPMTEIEQRKLARNAGLELIKGDQATNVFYSVMLINNRLLAVQPFTTDKQALTQAIQRVTGGLGGPKFATDSDAIAAELQRKLA